MREWERILKYKWENERNIVYNKNKSTFPVYWRFLKCERLGVIS